MAKKEWKDLNKKEKATGIITMLLIVVIIIGGISFIAGGGDKPDTKNVVDSSATEDRQLEQIVHSALPEKNNNGDTYIRKVEVVKQPSGSYGVFVEYNAENFNKVLIQEEHGKLYKALYTSDKNVGTASVTSYSPLLDSSGNESDQVVYKTILESAVAEKINWNAGNAALEIDILPRNWTVAVKHRSLND